MEIDTGTRGAANVDGRERPSAGRNRQREALDRERDGEGAAGRETCRPAGIAREPGDRGRRGRALEQAVEAGDGPLAFARGQSTIESLVAIVTVALVGVVVAALNAVPA